MQHRPIHHWSSPADELAVRDLLAHGVTAVRRTKTLSGHQPAELTHRVPLELTDRELHALDAICRACGWTRRHALRSALMSLAEHAIGDDA
ncbi:MAG: hypothetical protein OXT70_03440 [Chloroflexota bacterium]|nr:hypothetical protein [Chloroflexota bacterium]